MNSTEWNRVQVLFHRALALAKSERERFLDSECAGDAEIRAVVITMLESEEGESSPLDADVEAIARKLLSPGAGSDAPAEIGAYRVERVLGEGGMGVVLLAERKDAGNKVAIKLLSHALSPAHRRRFASEIRMLARLKHPFIARLYDAGSLPEGTPWFVMEYVEGQQLSDYLALNPLGVIDKLRLFRRICEAVQYAHAQEVIHRDLKPSNIMVEKDGTPRLLDFGIARQLQNTSEYGDRTSPGARFFSKDYAAPEWMSEGIVGWSTDIFSLGVILYEMLTGRRPFEWTKTDFEGGGGERRFIGKPSAVVRSPGKAHWKELDILCLTAIHPELQQRYQSIEALIRDVDHYVNDQPLEAMPERLGYRIGKFIRRNRRRVIAASAVSALLAVELVFFTVRLKVARDVAVAEAARTRRIQRFMLNLVGAGDQKAGPSNELRVTELLDRGAQQASMLNSDAETQAELYETIGAMYELLGKYPQADRMLEAGVARMKTAAGSNDPRFADTLTELAVLRGDEGRFKEAEDLARRGVAIVTKVRATDDAAVMTAKSILGQVLDESGKYEQALAVLDPLVRAKVSGGESLVALADGDTAYGYAENSLGRYDAAATWFTRALVLNRQLFGPAHPRVAFDMANVGTANVMVGRYRDAEANYTKALTIMKTWYGPDHPETAEIGAFLALVYNREGKLAEAEPLLQKVLSIEEQTKGRRHPYIAVVLDTMGKVAFRRGKLEAAEADFARALSINRAAFGDNRYQTAVCMEDLADVLNKERRYAEAEALLRTAVRVLGGMPASNNDSLPAAEVSLGHALLQQKHFREAERFLSAGYAFYQKQPQRSPDRLREAREDLAAVYHGMKEHDKTGRLHEGRSDGTRVKEGH